MRRTHYAGSLRETHVGEEVVLEGWVNRRRDLGGLIFLDLRDREGLVQLVAHPHSPAYATAERVRPEWVVRAKGLVRLRPEPNPRLATGRVEVELSSLEVLAEAKTPPFPVDAGWRGEEEKEVSEELRLKYRYLDLRRKRMQENLRLRHRVIKAIWDFLDREGFVQVETPFLTKSTPEGARDFLVPYRHEPGLFYALPQSPQLFKQMLMVAGLDRYFQIARCFRDEDLRADRQPDFTQLDLEMSFVEVEDVLELNERLMAHVFREALGVELPLPFPRLSYEEAMERYGSDKPDLRFGLELKEVGPLFRQSGFRVFQEAESVKALALPKALSRKEVAELEEVAKRHKAQGLAWARVEEGGFSGGVAKFLEPVRDALLEATGARAGDTLLFVAGPRKVAATALGAVRLRAADLLGLKREGPPLHEPPPRGPAPLGERPRPGSGLGLRPGAKRGGGGRRVHPHPRPRPPGPDVPDFGHRRGGAKGEVRVLPRGPGVRSPAPRGHRLGAGPPPRPHDGKPLHSRGHRLPQEQGGQGPPDRSPEPRARGAA